MQYLYGDSVLFPPQYDFLAALEVFCVQGARIVRLEAEGKTLRKSAEDAAAMRKFAVEALETFHREAVSALSEGAQDAGQPLVDDYVLQLGDLGNRLLEGAKRGAIEAGNREQQAALAEAGSRGVQVREALEKLLIAIRLPVTESQLKMTLTDGRNELSGIVTHAGPLVAAFELGGGAVEEWRQPKYVKNFAEKVILPVGVRRSLFKRTLAPETITLDDYVLSGFDLRDDQAELRLRKKPEHTDSLVFTVRRTDERIRAEVHHPDDNEADEGLPPLLDDISATEVERLWQLLRKAANPLLTNRKRLTSLSLAGNDVLAGSGGTTVVKLVVDAIAPIAVEIARRSPSRNELSLKVENNSGRREEIYLKKEQLENALATVPGAEQALFDPLGLVPSVIVT